MTRLTGSQAYELVEAYQSIYVPQELSEDQIMEDFENWVNDLVEDGYDLSDYTWNDMYNLYEDEIGRGANLLGRNIRSAVGRGVRAARDIYGASIQGIVGTPTTSRNPIARTANWVSRYNPYFAVPRMSIRGIQGLAGQNPYTTVKGGTPKPTPSVRPGSGTQISPIFDLNNPRNRAAFDAARRDAGLPSSPAGGSTRPAPALTGGTRPAPVSTGAARPAPALTGGTRPAPVSTGAARPAPALTGGTRPAPVSTGAARPSPALTGATGSTPVPTNATGAGLASTGAESQSSRSSLAQQRSEIEAMRLASQRRQATPAAVTARRSSPLIPGREANIERNIARARGTINSSFDPFDVVMGHLIDEGYADSYESALAIMSNMSEEWKNTILNS